MPATGASWIITGIASASDTVRKNSWIAASPARTVAPWYGGITITMAAPASCAGRERCAHTRLLKCVVVTITGTRPATCSRIAFISSTRSSSDSENCSEKLARMHRPCEPASIMKSTARNWPGRSIAPASSKMVGTTGNTPRQGRGLRSVMGAPAVLVRHGG